MSLIDDMVSATHNFKEKYPDPPQAQIKMHPDDYVALMNEVARSQFRRPSSITGLQIILDCDAQGVQESKMKKSPSSASEIIELEKDLGKQLEPMARGDRLALDEALMDVLLIAQSFDAHQAEQTK